MNNLYNPFLMVMVFTSPAFVLPLILGPVILRSYKDELGKFAGWLTLKPLIATPCWALMLELLDKFKLPKDPGQALSLLPAVVLTLLISWKFRGVFKAERTVFVFLAADALRWLNTYVWMHFDGRAQLTDPFLLAGWILPNAYAVMALIILVRRKKQSDQPTERSSGAWNPNSGE